MGGGDGLGVSGLASGTVAVVSYLLLFSQSSCFTIQIGAQGWCTTLALGILVSRRDACPFGEWCPYSVRASGAAPGRRGGVSWLVAR